MNFSEIDTQKSNETKTVNSKESKSFSRPNMTPKVQTVPIVKIQNEAKLTFEEPYSPIMFPTNNNSPQESPNERSHINLSHLEVWYFSFFIQ